MKKILFVVHTLQVGGAERVLINLLKKLDKTKFEITVFAIVNDGVYIEEVKNIEGIQYKYLFNTFFKNSRKDSKNKFHKLSKRVMDIIWKFYILLIKYIPKMLYKIGVKEKYDIEVAFLEGKVSKFVSNSTNKNSKKIAWIHTDINNVNGIDIFKNRKEETKSYERFSKIICVSEDVKERFSEKTGIKKNIYVQLNPICSDEILEKSNETIQEDLNHYGYVVCSVGRLVKEKGFDRLLEVHNRLIQENIIHTIWIVGEGIEREKLQQYIQNNHLEDTVNLIGYSQNPYKYVKKSDIFVCSSRFEGLSSALIEATVLGKVIISTKCPGTNEIVGNDGQAALVVENNTEALYEGMKKILTDPILRDKYRKNIKLRAKVFNIDNVIMQIEEILEK